MKIFKVFIKNCFLALLITVVLSTESLPAITFFYNNYQIISTYSNDYPIVNDFNANT